MGRMYWYMCISRLHEHKLSNTQHPLVVNTRSIQMLKTVANKNNLLSEMKVFKIYLRKMSGYNMYNFSTVREELHDSQPNTSRNESLEEQIPAKTPTEVTPTVKKSCCPLELS